jgi:hypothetical protein
MSRLVLLVLGTLSALPAVARAEPLTFTRTVIADYEFNLLGNSPINPGPETGFIPFRAIGDLTFELAASLNDPTATEVPFVNATGILTGVPPSPSAYLPHTISPNVRFLGGMLTNIVRDGAGSILSADVEDLNMEWELIAGGGALRLFGTAGVGLPFSGPVSGIPFPAGTVLAGEQPFDVFLDLGGGNSVLVAIGRNRTLTVVPEPTSIALVGLGVAGVVVAATRRRQANPRL